MKGMTARLFASKFSHTLESFAEASNLHTHMSVDVYDGYAYDSSLNEVSVNDRKSI